jgi:hypothetical protein
MGRACSVQERDEKCIQNFLSEILMGSDHMEDLGIDGRVMLEWILGK